MNFILYADDTNIFYTGANEKEVNNVLNDQLKLLSVWFKVNKLSLNVGKTNYITFTNQRCMKNFNSVIFIDGNVITKVCVTKFIGFLVDHKLSWEEHIKCIHTKVSKSLSILYKVRHILDTETLFTLYNSLICPYFNYACEVWGNNYQSRLHSLILLQKRIIRVVTKSKYYEHTIPLFQRLKCLNLIDLVKYKTLVFMFKVKQNVVPPNLQKYFTTVSKSHNISTRSNTQGLFAVSSCRTKAKSFNISISGVKLWNSISYEIRLCDAQSMSIFKHKIKTYLLRNY